MTGNEIREKFLQYFERHGHTRVRSSPLLPANDPTLLFTNAGMNQFKDVFLGTEKREYVRACSSQKCLRAGGKHNDLDEVGKTARHQTFFEMLGNFSFGDYFKEDAIKFAWDFLVNELKMDSSRLWFTVFGGDEEVGPDEDAEKLWEQAGAPRDRILRFGRKDNFWQMGETGPCGPCSEIHYYLGDDPDDPTKNRIDLVNGPGDTTMEIWNLVFMQYNRIEGEPGKYNLEPLPKPSVDTGLGLERTAVIMQGVKSNYETDLLKDIVDCTAKLAGRKYEAETPEGFAMRVIADHARATAFSIADGILPGNEGRNYVLRKIMRRAIYQGRHTLEFEDLFFYKVTNFVVDQMGAAYPELEASREFIEKMVKLEEERFGSTMTVGLQKLDELFARTAEGQFPEWKELARLYDTFGTPRDLVRVAYEERGLITLDEETFNSRFDLALRDLQQTSATEKVEGKATAKLILPNVAGKTSLFRGYETTRVDDGKVLVLLDGLEQVSELSEGQEGEVVLDQTPFYAESGGQVGDVGKIIEPSLTVGLPPLIATVTDTYSPAQGLIVHKVKVEKGTLRIGDVVTAEVDVEKRDATRRNHTATHLMHAALREVLGTHVKQAGSVVAPNYLRFDFSHYQPLTATEIEEIERLVNYHILRNEPVQTDEMAVEEAMRSGAMALFGEKYGEKVRVLSIKGAEAIFSKELCGGTHVRATGDIGVFKITSDESIASGVRRIRAVTGVEAYERFREDEEIIGQVTSNLRTSRAELPAMVGKLQDELKKARREADELRLKIATGAAGASSSNGDDAREVNGIRVLAREASGLDAAGMRQLSDTLLARIKSGVVVVGRSNDGKASLIVRTSDDLTKKIPAGQVIKELAPIIGGKGGGKPDMAEGGGNQPEKLTEALEASYGVIERMLQS
ncbi:MAG TPA: alanine--tRNA ligase [Pyrinomonadaceae bacterium]|nr:alanine--tRNA ligase [Pyrinomonadaceae bacterium]